MNATPRNRYFFIVGSARSGTTLLQGMLMQSPGVTIPPETKLMTSTYRHRRVLGDIESDSGWAAAINIVCANNDREEFPVDGAELRERLLSVKERSYGRLLTEWLDACGEAKGAGVIGEKTPVHAAYAEKIAAEIPTARFVQIIRDPRDVAYSQCELWDRTMLSAAIRWKLDQRLVARHTKVLGRDRFAWVKYEDLVSNPEDHLRRISGFLDIEFVPEMCDPSNRKDQGFSSRETHKLQTLESVTTARIGRYKNSLNRSEIALVQALCEPEMVEFGYELEPYSRARGLLDALSMLPKQILKRAKEKKQAVNRLTGNAQGPSTEG